ARARPARAPGVGGERRVVPAGQVPAVAGGRRARAVGGRGAGAADGGGVIGPGGTAGGEQGRRGDGEQAPSAGPRAGARRERERHGSGPRGARSNVATTAGAAGP